MEIRRMESRDVKRIAEIEAQSFPDPYSERSINDILCTEGSMCFTALDGDTPIAYFIGRIIPPEGELYRIATAQRWRGRGVAYRLLDYAVKTSRGVGLETLFLEVRESNTPAISLYKKFGMREVGRRKKYYRDPTEDALLFAKE
jgi:ribosomal-protein-alanine N-acetyltransferase